MRLTHLAAVLVAALLSAPALAAGADDALLAPIHQFIDGLNKKDMKAAAAAHVAAPSIIDDVAAPHIWQGEGAFDRWAASDAAKLQQDGVTEPKVEIKKPSQLRHEGDTAYVVVPTVYSFKMKGKKIAGDGYMTFALVQQGPDWRIAAWAWTQR